MCKGIPVFMLKWRVLFLWAVRGITSLQKAHLHEDIKASNEGRGPRTELYHTTAFLQSMHLEQVLKRSCNWQVAGL